jgi:tRNA pseudouridine38-40 synthase
MRLVLEYDGTGFHGWQAQPGGQRTVQGEVERALATVTGERPKLVAAGRTDAGAHSLGQTVNFELGRELQPERLRESLNGVLPRDIAVLRAATAPDDFHARFSASRRRYRYLVENRDARAAVLRDRAWHVRQALDIDAMRTAARDLIGRRDLSAFGHDPAGRDDVRNLQEIRVRRLRGATEGKVIAFDLTADAFLYGMVRRIVGFLVEVGLGRREAGDAARLLAGEGSTPRVAPAHGLYQLSVEYPAAVLAA